MARKSIHEALARECRKARRLEDLLSITQQERDEAEGEARLLSAQLTELRQRLGGKDEELARLRLVAVLQLRGEE